MEENQVVAMSRHVTVAMASEGEAGPTEGPRGRIDWNAVHSRNIFSQCSSVTQLCLTLCDPMNRSTPGLPVHHQLLEFTQTHVH